MNFSHLARQCSLQEPRLPNKKPNTSHEKHCFELLVRIVQETPKPGLLLFGWRLPSSHWHPYIQRVWIVRVEVPHPSSLSWELPQSRHFPPQKPPPKDDLESFLKIPTTTSTGYLKWPPPKNKHMVFLSSFPVSSLWGWKANWERLYPSNAGFI